MIARGQSLRRKVAFAVFAVICASLLLAATGLGWFEYRAAKDRLKTNLESLAQISFTQVIPAVDFYVPEAGGEALARLQSSNLVTAATVFLPRAGPDGAPFAQFIRHDRKLHFGGTAREDGFYLDGDRALLVTTFLREGAKVATLQLEGDLASTRRDLVASFQLLGVVFIVLLGFGWILAGWLERAITRPLLALSETARRVHETGDFGLRATVEARDEVGELADQFNDMLAGIAARDRKLAESSAFQTAILANAGVAVIGTDPQGRVITFNPEAEKMLGYRAEEVVGRADPGLWHDPAEVAERAADLTRKLGRPVAAGFETFVAPAQRGGSHESEWTFVRKDRRPVPVHLVISELREAGGTLVGYVGLATDLTERRRREHALRSFSELTAGVTGRDFFTAIVRQLALELGVRYALVGAVVEGEGGRSSIQTLAVWAGGPAGNLRYDLAGTPCENVMLQGLCHYPDTVAAQFPADRLLVDLGARSYAGVPMRDHTGRTLGVLVVLDDKPMPEIDAASFLLVLSATRSAAELQRMRNEEQITRLNADLEARVHDRTAELASRVAQVEQLNREQHELMRSLTASEKSADRAASRLQEANANLLAANQELEAFSYSVSHDLRAPLRNITGFIELLAKRAGGQIDGESRRFVATVIGEAARMGMLIDDLLTFSRIGRTEMKLQSVCLDELVAEVREELKTDIGERLIEWRLAPLPLVSGDRALLRQVIVNLLSNAVKFTRLRPSAEIEVGVSATRSVEPTLTFFVRDNGAGFNPKYVEKLFGVFQRLHNQKDFEGTGIGLANVKRIVNRHGGRVWAEGGANQGATFYFTLKPAAES